MNSSMAGIYASAIAEEMGYVPDADVKSFIAGARYALTGEESDIRNIHIPSFRTGSSEAKKDAGQLDAEARRQIYIMLDLMIGE